MKPSQSLPLSAFNYWQRNYNRGAIPHIKASLERFGYIRKIVVWRKRIVAAGNGVELDAITAVVMGGTLLTGGVGYIAGTFVGIMIQGVIQTYVTFDGTLNSWWAKIVIGILLFVFIVLQKVLSSGKNPFHMFNRLRFVQR